MTVSIECPSCGKAYHVGDESLGAKAKCKSCGATFTLSMSVDETGKSKADAAPVGQAAHSQSAAGKAQRQPAAAPAPGKAGHDEMPKKLGQYVVQRKLGAGAMGVVYLARDPILDRQVAVKVLPAELSRDEERLKRFLREAKSAARLHHTNVAAVHQAGAEGRLAYIAMEYVEGTSLDKAASETKPMDWREATRAIRDAAAGLGAAHAIGLVHRDIKPANLIRTKDGVTKVVDFGLARGQQTNSQLTQQGTLLGTPAYMAPEQWTGAEIDGRTDLYALTCTFYFLLTGRLAFDAPSLPALGYQHRYEAFPDPRKHVPNLPDGVCRILSRGSAKEPAERYQSAEELGAELDVLLASRDESLACGSSWAQFAASAGLDLPPPQPAPVSSRSARAQRDVPRWVWIATGGAAAVLLLLGVMIVFSTKYGTVQIALKGPVAQDVQVTLDGEMIAIDGLDEPLELKVGEHELTASSPSFQTVTRSFLVKKNETTVVEVTFVPEVVAAIPTKPPPEPPKQAAVRKAPPPRAEPVPPAVEGTVADEPRAVVTKGSSGTYLTVGSRTYLVTETRVNDVTPERQYAPSIAVLTNGNYVVGWVSHGPDPGSDCYGRLYSADGSVLNSRFRLNAGLQGGWEYGPGLAPLPDGGLVAAFGHESASSHFQCFDSQMKPGVGASCGPYDTWPAVAGDSQGNFFLAGGQCDKRPLLFVRGYSASGKPLADAWQWPEVNLWTKPAVAAAPGGVFTVAWPSPAGPLVARHFGLDGKPVGETFTVWSSPGSSPSMAYDRQGDLVVAWEGTDSGGVKGIFARRFSGSGEPLTSEWHVKRSKGVFPSRAHLAFGPDDEVLVAWSAPDGSREGVFGRLYDRAGNPLSPEFPVNLHTSGDQLLGHFCGQRGAAIHESTLLFAWEGAGPGDDEGIFLTVLTPVEDGRLVGKWAYLARRPVSGITQTPLASTLQADAVPLTAAQLAAVEAQDGVCLDNGFCHLFKFLNRGVTHIEWTGYGKGNGRILIHYWDGSQMVRTEIPEASELATHRIPVSVPASEEFVHVMVNCTGGQVCTDAITDDGGG